MRSPWKFNWALNPKTEGRRPCKADRSTGSQEPRETGSSRKSSPLNPWREAPGPRITQEHISVVFGIQFVGVCSGRAQRRHKCGPRSDLDPDAATLQTQTGTQL